LSIMKILIAEDDREIAESLRDGLTACGYSTTIVGQGTMVEPSLENSHYDLLILDVMLPGMNGFDVCRRLRAKKVVVPILMVTARDALRDRVTGLDVGADDYLAKPFQFPELHARIRALTRRHDAVKSTEIQVADLYVDSLRNLVKRGEKEVSLTKREFQLLYALIRNAGKTLSKERLSQEVWDDQFTSANTIEAHIRNLRRKINDDDTTQKLIHTVYGIGYTLKEPS
jgi:DNA-binding response OmpR family regulator